MPESSSRLVLFAMAVVLLAGGCGPDAVPPPPEDTAAADAEVDVVRPTITATNAFYYYADLEAAWEFYTDIMGLETVADYGFAKILRVASTSYLTLVDAERGMHSADEPKTVTLALVTDEVERWYEYLVGAGVTMRGEFTPSTGRPHVGFVAVDPEGYLLEFERFEPHPENELLLPAIDALQPLFPREGATTQRPRDLGVRATILWLYYRDTAAANDFYSGVLGADPIVDQGWAWAHRVSSSGFLGVVDGDSRTVL